MSIQLKMSKVDIRTAGELLTRGQDENGVYWYLWDEVCHILLIPSRAKNEIFNKCVNDYEQDVFDYGPSKRDLFITTDAFIRIVNRNNKRANNIIKEVINNENRPNIFEKNELDKKFEKIKTILERPGVPNYVDACLEVKEIWFSDEYRDTLDKFDETFDKEMEEALDNIRYKLSNGEIIHLIGGNEEDDMVFEMQYKDGIITVEEWVNGKSMM